MAGTFKGVAKLLANILGLILPLITQKFREEIEEFIKRKYGEALLTENPWDDYLFEFLATAFKIDLE